MWDSLMLFLLAVATGTAGGMGLGGGSLLVVLLSSLFSYDQKVAQKINIVCFLPTALAATVLHIKNKEVDIKTALTVAVSGLVSAVPFAVLSLEMEGALLKKFFGGLLLLMGAVTVWNLNRSAK